MMLTSNCLLFNSTPANNQRHRAALAQDYEDSRARIRRLESHLVKVLAKRAQLEATEQELQAQISVLESVDGWAEIEEVGGEVRRLEGEVVVEERRTAEARKEGVRLRQQVESVRAELDSITGLIAQQQERVAAEAVSGAAAVATKKQESQAEAGRWRDQARSLEDKIAEARAEDARSISRPQSGQSHSTWLGLFSSADFVLPAQLRPRATAHQRRHRSLLPARRTLARSGWSSGR